MTKFGRSWFHRRKCTMDESRRWASGTSRRGFLKGGAAVAAGTVLARRSQWTQSSSARAAKFEAAAWAGPIFNERVVQAMPVVGI